MFTQGWILIDIHALQRETNKDYSIMFGQYVNKVYWKCSVTYYIIIDEYSAVAYRAYHLSKATFSEVTI